MSTHDLWRVWSYLRKPKSSGRKTDIDIRFLADSSALIDFSANDSPLLTSQKLSEDTAKPCPTRFLISSVKRRSFGHRLMLTFVDGNRKSRVLTIYSERQEIRFLAKHLARRKY